MKILFDASAIFAKQKGGGVYNYLIELLPRLAKLCENNGDEFRYFNLFFRGTTANNKFIPTNKIDSLRLPVRLVNMLWTKFSIPDLSWFWKDVDIFHSPHFSLPVMSKTKKILTVNDITYLKYPQYYSETGRHLNEYGYKKLLSTNIVRANKIIAISYHTMMDIMEYFKISEDKIEVVHIGCSIPKALPAKKRKQILSQFSLHESEFIYFPVGTYEPRKNLERTINAFKKTDASKVKLVISGVGNTNWLEKNIINDKVIFARWNTEEERDALYQSAIFAIYPSLYEGFGIPALEAMANGKALLTSNISSLPEITSGYAHMVNPHDLDEIADGIHLLLKDEKYRTELEKKSIERAKSFSWEKMAEETYSVYKSIY